MRTFSAFDMQGSIARNRGCIALASVIELLDNHKDADDTAEKLYLRFGDLRGILSAKFSELENEGLAEKEIVFLKLLNAIVSAYYSERISGTDLHRTGGGSLRKYLLGKYSELPKEHLVAILFDVKGNLLREVLMNRGNPTNVKLETGKLLEEIFSLNAASLALAHNHPTGCPEPSPQDLLVTQELEHVLSHIGIKLLDHYVIGDNLLYSIKSGKYI